MPGMVYIIPQKKLTVTSVAFKILPVRTVMIQCTGYTYLQTHAHVCNFSWYYDRKPKNIITAIKDNYCNNLVGLCFGSSTLKCADTCTLSVPNLLAFSEMEEFNKRKRTEFIEGSVSQKSRKRPNSAMFRRVSLKK